MPAIRTRDKEELPGSPCRVRNEHGREVLLRSLSSSQLKELDKTGKQYKYHENLNRYISKRIDLRGEYGSSRSPIPYSIETVMESGKPPPFRPSDLELVRILGEGAFGAVGVVKAKKREPKHPRDVPRAQMAIKIFSKSELREDAPSQDVTCAKVDAVHDLLNLERRNLVMIEWNPFVAGLYTCLQDSKNLYQLMELGHLGSLKKLIQERGALPTSVCRFYFANLVKITEFLHGIGLIHSDMKPENIVIGADGYLMICDLGISAFREEQRNWNSVGTTAYTSPEALQGKLSKEVAESVDWWGVACILYEMATGRAVFRYLKGTTDGRGTQERKSELVQRIVACKWWWPRKLEVDPALKDLVERMLHRDFEKRLGSVVPAPEGCEYPLKNEEVRAHPFVRQFPWKKLGERALAAPFTPNHVPDLGEDEWHSKPLPQQRDVPGITVLEPVPHVRWDKRCRRKQDERRFEREKELVKWNKDRLHQSRDARIAYIEANGNASSSSDSGEGVDQHDVNERLKDAQAKMRDLERTMSSSRQPLLSEQRQSSTHPIPPNGIVPRLRHPAIERILKGTDRQGRRREGRYEASMEIPTEASPNIDSESCDAHSAHHLPTQPTDFNMFDRTKQPKCVLKEPILPEQIFVGEFGRLTVASNGGGTGDSDESNDMCH